MKEPFLWALGAVLLIWSLVGLFTYAQAGGHQQTSPTHSHPYTPASQETPIKEVPVVALPPKPTVELRPVDNATVILPSKAPEIPTVINSNFVSNSGGGGSMVWCSGPTAPGWRVDLEDGGCRSIANTVPSATGTSPSTVTRVTAVRLSDMPYTGVVHPFKEFFFAILELLLNK